MEHTQTSYIHTFLKVNQDVRMKELRAQTNSFRWEADTEHQTGEQYSNQGIINA